VSTLGNKLCTWVGVVCRHMSVVVLSRWREAQQQRACGLLEWKLRTYSTVTLAVV